MATLHVEVVSAARTVWSGESSSIIAKTVEGDMGILPGHSPVLAVLAPSAVEVQTEDGTREIIAVGTGFISVADGRVSILSEYAQLASEITLDEAKRDLERATSDLDTDADDEDARSRYEHALAQVRAANKAQ